MPFRPSLLASLAVTTLIALVSLGCGHQPLLPTSENIPREQTEHALNQLRENRHLNDLCAQAVRQVLASHETLSPTDIGLALMVEGSRPRIGGFNGLAPQSAGAFVALPLATVAMERRSQGALTDFLVTQPMMNALRLEDVDSINGLIDVLTATETGRMIIGPSQTEFLRRRAQINRDLNALGIIGMGVSHRLPEPLTGREAQASEAMGGNQMNPRATASLLWLLDQGQIIGHTRATLIVDSLRREGDARVMTSQLDGTDHRAVIVSRPDGSRVIAVAMIQRGNLPPVAAREAVTALLGLLDPQ